MGLNHGQHLLFEFDTRHSSQPAEGNLGDSGDTGEFGEAGDEAGCSFLDEFYFGTRVEESQQHR